MPVQLNFKRFFARHIPQKYLKGDKAVFMVKDSGLAQKANIVLC
jgi:hypothetical protein